MIPEFFEDFIRFGNLLDKTCRELLVKYWLSKFNMEIEPDLSSKLSLLSYKDTIDKFCKNDSLIKIARQNENIFQDISKRFIDSLENLQKNQINKSPFQDEEIAFLKWKNQTTDTFLNNGKDSLKDIQKYNGSGEFNYSFFSEQLEKYQLSEGKKIPKEKRDALKQEILDRWNSLLEKKKHQHFLEELDKVRQKICEEIYKQIEQFKKLMQVLQPFTNECGRLWDLSKGSWQNVGFDILEKYTELLQKEPELQKLAEMLGKMHQAEDELEEEEIKETIVIPYKQIIHAGKSELVGCHESNDINNLLPIELTLLNNPVTELVFYKKFAEKKLTA